MLTSAGMAHSAEVIRAARELNPTIRVLARAAYLRDLPPLKNAGADTVYRAKARWRWHSSRTSSIRSVQRRSRSTGNARARMRSCLGARKESDTPLRPSP